MDHDIHMKAVRRYGAMTGSLKDASPEERVRAVTDRTQFSEYNPNQPCGWDKAALLLRFMHEVCCIPLWQARACTIVVIQTNRAHEIDPNLPGPVASRIVQETGNILIAEATASLYAEAAEDTEWHALWKDVLGTLRHGEVVADEDMPSEDYTLH